MAAILGGTMRSPLTGVVFAIELTHRFDLVVPLMIAVIVAHAFTVLVLRRSILTEKVARRGYHVSREYAIDELEILFARDAMNADIIVLASTDTVRDVIAKVVAPDSDRSQHLFPIVDGDATLVGAVTYARLRDAADPAGPVGALADDVPTVFSNETLRTAVHRMAETGATRLLVLNREDARKLVGKLALHDVLRARTRHVQDERRRERVIAVEYLIPRWIRERARNLGGRDPA
jgi:CBS domain-containing protein